MPLQFPLKGAISAVSKKGLGYRILNADSAFCVVVSLWLTNAEEDLSCPAIASETTRASCSQGILPSPTTGLSNVVHSLDASSPSCSSLHMQSNHGLLTLPLPSKVSFRLKGSPQRLWDRQAGTNTLVPISDKNITIWLEQTSVKSTLQRLCFLACTESRVIGLLPDDLDRCTVLKMSVTSAGLAPSRSMCERAGPLLAQASFVGLTQ